MSDTANEFPVIPDLHWGNELHTGDTRMDETHEEFVDMLARLRALPDSEQLPLYRELVQHTVEHFAQEDRWMVATGFSADNCHTSQHNSILDTMRAVETHYLQGDTEIISRMAAALAEWFPMHAQSMDAGLAQHMQSVKFDSRSETLEDPSLVRPATMSGCGSVSCS
ncbi:hemerythrin domain-containing protein [Hydrogenophaga aquatica]